MAGNIWHECSGEKHFALMSETVWRIVETREMTSTRKLVDSLGEQILLEKMIESIKPPIPADCLGLHPLLYTPFRYPPLPRGSRFGKKQERGLWYGSLRLQTAMAEKSFYRFNFLRASEATYDVITTQLTAFSVKIKSSRAIKLIDKPFSKYKNVISSPIDYSDSQNLGAAMREAGVHVFNYQSARDIELGANIVLFSSEAFVNKQPDQHSFQAWQCSTDYHSVEFIRVSSLDTIAYHFPIEMFLVEGKLPSPAF